MERRRFRQRSAFLTVVALVLFAVACGRASEEQINQALGITPDRIEPGQWGSFHANLTGETAGYYGDFVGLDKVSKVLREVFLHDGGWSSFRERAHGRPVPATVPGQPRRAARRAGRSSARSPER